MHKRLYLIALPNVHSCASISLVGTCSMTNPAQVVEVPVGQLPVVLSPSFLSRSLRSLNNPLPCSPFSLITANPAVFSALTHLVVRRRFADVLLLCHSPFTTPSSCPNCYAFPLFLSILSLFTPRFSVWCPRSSPRFPGLPAVRIRARGSRRRNGDARRRRTESPPRCR